MTRTNYDVLTMQNIMTKFAYTNLAYRVTRVIRRRLVYGRIYNSSYLHFKDFMKSVHFQKHESDDAFKIA